MEAYELNFDLPAMKNTSRCGDGAIRPSAASLRSGDIEVLSARSKRLASSP